MASYIAEKLRGCGHDNPARAAFGLPDRVAAEVLWSTIAAAIDEEIDERYIEAPTSSDGEPWRLGDYIQPLGADGPRKVIGLGKRSVFYEDHGEIRHATASINIRTSIDSWERVRDDSSLDVEEYCRNRGIKCESREGEERLLWLARAMTKDIYSRSRALSEKEA